MSFIDYIDILKKYLGCNQVETVQELFENAGCKNKPRGETVKSWFHRTENAEKLRYRKRDYFPNNRVDSDRLKKYLKSHIEKSWRNIQECFGSKEAPEKNVDTTTDNFECFLDSLVLQFQWFLDVDIPIQPTEVDSNSSNTKENSLLQKSEQGAFLPTETAQENCANLERKSDGWNVNSILPKPGAQLYIDPKYKLCVFCSNWKGKIDDRCASCKIYHKKTKVGDGHSCPYYVPTRTERNIEWLIKSGSI